MVMVITITLSAIVGLYNDGTIHKLSSILFKSYTEYREESIRDNKIRAEPVFLGTKVERFVLSEFNPPKHVYVTLKHVNSGVIYGPLYVSKHCNNRPVLHAEYNIQVSEYRDAYDPQKITWRFNNLSVEFCSNT